MPKNENGEKTKKNAVNKWIIAWDIFLQFSYLVFVCVCC